MDICWRWPPMIALIALVGHATSWFGTADSSAAPPSGLAADLGGLLSGADSVINQAFAWLFVLIAFEVFCCAFGYVIGEYKLRRLYDRPSRGRGHPATPSAPRQRPQL